MSRIGVREGESQLVLKLDGAIDASRVGELLATAIAACGSGKAVVLDWSEAEHLHAGALQVLFALHAQLAVQGRPLQFSDCSPALEDCIVAAGLVHAFPGGLNCIRP
jgi:anti-anti-sigma regulatory factor